MRIRVEEIYQYYDNVIDDLIKNYDYFISDEVVAESIVEKELMYNCLSINALLNLMDIKRNHSLFYRAKLERHINYELGIFDEDKLFRCIQLL